MYVSMRDGEDDIKIDYVDTDRETDTVWVGLADETNSKVEFGLRSVSRGVEFTWDLFKRMLERQTENLVGRRVRVRDGGELVEGVCVKADVNIVDVAGVRSLEWVGCSVWDDGEYSEWDVLFSDVKVLDERDDATVEKFNALVTQIGEHAAAVQWREGREALQTSP